MNDIPIQPELTFDEKPHAYFWNGKKVPNITSLILDVGLTDMTFVPTNALARGSDVHFATLLYDEHDLDMDTVTDEIRPYLNAYISAMDRLEWTPVIREVRWYSEKWGYAGTVDGIYLTKDVNHLLCEIKSTDGPEQDSWKIQTAAQEELWKPHFPNVERYTLQLKSDGSFRLHGPYTDPMDLVAFQAALIIHGRKGK